VKVYDKGVTVNGEARHGRHIYQMLVGYRTGDMCAPRLDTREALAIELEEFARCIVTGERPSADSAAGWRIVRILEAATRSMQERGRTIELEPVACPV
jgi:predicted dehydrogenase